MDGTDGHQSVLNGNRALGDVEDEYVPKAAVKISRQLRSSLFYEELKASLFTRVVERLGLDLAQASGRIAITATACGETYEKDEFISGGMKRGVGGNLRPYSVGIPVASHRISLFVFWRTPEVSQTL